MKSRYYINNDLLGLEFEPFSVEWTDRDSLLYAVSVGCGADELKFVTENSIGIEQEVLPTFCTVLTLTHQNALDAWWKDVARIGKYNTAKSLHAGQKIKMHMPLAPAGSALIKRRVVEVLDKGHATIVGFAMDGFDAPTGNLLFSTHLSLFIREIGGWGGPRGEAGRSLSPPDRQPDLSICYQTTRDQHLLYRLTGDRHPIHSDPLTARSVGFEGPIMHGLCTYGFAARAILELLCNNDTRKFVSMAGKFRSVCYPGSLLTANVWQDESNQATFVLKDQDGKVIIGDGRCEYAP